MEETEVQMMKRKTIYLKKNYSIIKCDALF